MIIDNNTTGKPTAINESIVHSHLPIGGRERSVAPIYSIASAAPQIAQTGARRATVPAANADTTGRRGRATADRRATTLQPAAAAAIVHEASRAGAARRASAAAATTRMVAVRRWPANVLLLLLVDDVTAADTDASATTQRHISGHNSGTDAVRSIVECGPPIHIVG